MTKEDKAKSPKSKKTKDGNVKEVEPEAVPYEVRMRAVTVISKPMADEKKVSILSYCTSTSTGQYDTRYDIIYHICNRVNTIGTRAIAVLNSAYVIDGYRTIAVLGCV